MNDITAVIDENVLEWLDDTFTPHELQDVLGAVNNLVYAHREQLQIPVLQSDEDLAALTHEDLRKLFSLAAPKEQHEFVLSNQQLLALTLAALKVIDYKLPAVNSPLLVRRVFADKNRKSTITGFTPRTDLSRVVNEWLCGLRDIDMSHAGTEHVPDVAGQYLCLDEHNQIRFGCLFRNSADGWTFAEYTDDGATFWFCPESCDADNLPLGLLSNWVLVVERNSPNIRLHSNHADPMVSDTHRIFMFLRSLSPHVKAELVAHFDGLFDKKLPSVDAIGRLTEQEWHKAADWMADDDQMDKDLTAWSKHSAWSCFVATLNGLDFNFETRQFNPQYDHQANDDVAEEDDE